MSQRTISSHAVILVGSLVAITLFQRTARTHAAALGISPVALTGVSAAITLALARTRS